MFVKTPVLSGFLAVWLAAGSLLAREEDGLEFFEKHVRPVLVERCYECHSASKKTKGGLALDTRDATLRGGDSGPAVIAGDPEKSLLIDAVRYKNHDLQMPPRQRLPEAEIQILEAWITKGAPDPRLAPVAPARAAQSINVEAGREFWSFKPLARVEPPVSGPGTTAIDAFIQEKLRAKGLAPAPPADRRTLIRRATYDLTGLPPAPEEVDAFVADTEPGAFERVVERLLASPRYGERWGRHWLDVARYADSNGMDENLAYGNAWRYRDYVVNAFNADKPFDQFLVEQVAGDLLPRSEEAITGTGFLLLGAKVLAEPDLQKLEMDIIDEQLDTLGKAFMGMTLGCVRCHDHKFDPLTQEDYYGLAAIFRSTRSLSTERKGAIKFWNEHSLATARQIEEKKTHEAEAKAKKAEVAAFVSKARAAVRAEAQRRAADYLAVAVLLPPSAESADARRVADGRSLDAGILLACRRYLDRKPVPAVLSDWEMFAADEDAEAARAHYGPLFASALESKKGAAYEALTDAKGFLALPGRDADVLDADTLARLSAMNKEVEALEAKYPELPAIMGVADGSVTRTLPVHIRGSHLTLGKPVERGFPEVMRTSRVRPILPVKQSGRLEFARWLASGEHPLTARVFVNRLWRWHFGQGLVSTPDNFGEKGGRPSHPELLDWLARTFVERGWSVKDMHRLILKTAAYQQSTRPAPSAPGAADPAVVDPDNRFLWRANIQRLEAEQIRDAMVFVSGALDTAMGGKTIALRDKEFVFNHTSRDATTYESTRRALYLPIIRNNLHDVFEQFDYPDPSTPTGSRNSTVVAPQALILLNAPVVLRSSERLAARLAMLSNDTERITRAYQLLYARSPDDREQRRALVLLEKFRAGENPGRAWAQLCQTLFAANEFIYLR
jgi:hypothetical protein